VPERKTLLTVGGVALMIEGVAYLLITITGGLIGVTPGDDPRWLQAITTQPALSLITYGVLTGVADLVLIPGALALYLAFRKNHGAVMLVAAAVLLSYVAIDVSTFVSTSTAITLLAQGYAATTDQAQRAAFLAAEYYGLSTIPLSQFLGWFYPSMGYVIVSCVMLREGVHGAAPYLGVAAGVVDIIASFSFLFPGTALELLMSPGLALLGLFALFAGLALVRMARSTAIEANVEEASG